MSKTISYPPRTPKKRHAVRDRMAALLGTTSMMGMKLIMDTKMAGWPAMEYLIYTILGIGAIMVVGSGVVIAVGDVKPEIDHSTYRVRDPYRLAGRVGFGAASRTNASLSI